MGNCTSTREKREYNNPNEQSIIPHVIIDNKNDNKTNNINNQVPPFEEIDYIFQKYQNQFVK